jgi:ribose transport system ATP-binding protein
VTSLPSPDFESGETNASGSPLLELAGVSKSFPGVNALENVSLRLDRGQIVALMGENGAGKSTLIRVLGGAHRPDSGDIRIDGVPVRFTQPLEAMRAGIGIVYQELSLIPALNACDNIFLGHSHRPWWISPSDDRRQAVGIFQRMGVDVPLDVPVRQLSIAQQQLVEIARILSQDVRILVMDEPTAALNPQEVRRLFQLIAELKAQGIGIIYVSHRLEEVLEISDRVTILRDGRYIANLPAEQLTRPRLIELMVGRPADREFHRTPTSAGEVCLEVAGLRREPRVRDVSFSLHRGEILGLTGLAGAGRTEVARLIFGADRADQGSIRLNGRLVSIENPRDAIREGICLLTEDRKAQGLIPARSVCENFSLPNLTEFQSLGLMRIAREHSAFARFVNRLRIRISSQNQAAKTLSGGNQQKVLLARWLQRDAQVILFDEPTRGIDVGAKQEIYQLIQSLAESGKAILLISSELPEILNLCDRILVMRDGQITATIPRTPTTTQEDIMEHAVA